jgi:hypothetical protein
VQWQDAHEPYIILFALSTVSPCIREVLENLTVAQFANKFPALYETRRLITVIVTDYHWVISWARWIQSTISYPKSQRCILILSSHLSLDPPAGGLFPLGLPAKSLYAFFISPIRTTCPAHLILLGLRTLIFGEETYYEGPIYVFLSVTVLLHLRYAYTFSCPLCLSYVTLRGNLQIKTGASYPENCDVVNRCTRLIRVVVLVHHLAQHHVRYTESL